MTPRPPSPGAAARPPAASRNVRRTGRRRGAAFRPRRPPARALAEAVRAVAVMVDARLPLVDALRAAAGQSRSPRLRDALARAAAHVHRGRSLSDALLADPAAFGPVLPQVVRVGEAVGTLGDTLLRLADHLEKADALRRKVRLALVYPGLVLAIAVGAVAFLLAFVVPTFADLFADFGAELPAPTRAVIAVSDGLRTHGLWLAALAALAVLAARAALRSERGGAAWDALRLRVPLLGTIASQGLAARFAGTLATLLRSGVPLVDALDVAAGAAENRALAHALHQARRRVVRGGALGPPLAASGLLPPLLSQMVSVGEATGELADVLDRTAAHFDREVDASVGALTSVIEPLLVLVLGVVVGSVLIAIYLPMFDLVTVLE